MDFEKINYFACLLDFYQNVLTEKQRRVAKMFFYENLGYTEIATLENTTKQAISDLLKRTQAILESYENRLNIYQKYRQSVDLLSENIEIKEKFLKIWE